MKTFLTVVITFITTWIIASVVHDVRVVRDRLWMVSAVKAPGRMAIADIQTDLSAHRYIVAKAKMDAFAMTWQRFEADPDSFKGRGIGDIMVTFSKIPNLEQ